MGESSSRSTPVFRCRLAGWCRSPWCSTKGPISGAATEPPVSSRARAASTSTTSVLRDIRGHPPRTTATARRSSSRRRRSRSCSVSRSRSRSANALTGGRSPEPPSRPLPYDGRVLEPSVFKAYDVRGLYGTELDEDGAYAIGRAYAEEFEPRSMAVGRDMRVSSPAMATALIRGAADGGADVLDVGMVGTEMLYHAVGSLGLEGGICVTASHNPK